MNIDPKTKVLQANVNKLLNERESLKKKIDKLKERIVKLEGEQGLPDIDTDKIGGTD
jgi:peptidoglycan hydrolase CwlO-like protein